MKRAFLYTSVLSLAGLLFSCDDFLDKVPDNRTELNTEKSIAKILVSAYPEAGYCEIAEMHSDNIDENSKLLTYLFRIDEDMYHWRETTEEGQDTPNSLWQSCYQAIAAANQALKAIERMGNPASLTPQKGEALVCRAYAHYTLASIFCKAYSSHAENDLGIPYMCELETTVAPKYERGTLTETYQKIAADLEAGLPLIDDNAYQKPKYHFNKKAAYAFAARFYLNYMQPDFSNCQKVIDAANMVLGKNAAENLRDWKSLGLLSANYDVQPNAYINADNPANLLLLSSYSYWPLVADPGYGACQKYCSNNITAAENCKSTGPWGAQTNYWQEPFAPGSSIKNGFRRLALYQEITSGNSMLGHMIFPAFTTDETLLCRAEAYALLKRYDEAAADIDTWQKAFTKNTATLTKESIDAFYAALPYYEPGNIDNPSVKKELNPDFEVLPGMQENLIHCILHARRILTLEEGARWFDIKRYGIVIYRRYFEGTRLMGITDQMDVDDPRRAIQIPANVVSAGMEPNPRNN